MTTRTQVADYIATELANERETAVKQAAAWLVANKRERQADYLVNDIAKALQRKGYLYARITSAHKLDEKTCEQLHRYLDDLGPDHVETEFFIDPGVIGGIKVELPTAALDATVRMKLDRLVEGLIA